MADRPVSIAQYGEGDASILTTVNELVTKMNTKGGLDKEDNKKAAEIIKLLRESNEWSSRSSEERRALLQAEKDSNKENMKNWAKSFKDGEKNTERLGKIVAGALQQIDNHIRTFTQYSIQVNAALDGTQKTYASAVQNLTNAIGSTGLASMSTVLSEMNKLTEKGIVANIEQNAFLMSIKDGIADTFNAANGTLLRLIKLQGEDSTVNRLVMQASLKEYLNQTYNNSQYLYEQFDNVSANLLEATSLLTSSLGNSLEATVQKWLGSLSSLGLSDTAVSSLSSALGAVGSGNLRGINENMQNLVIMGANRAGLSYSDLLTGGLSSEDTDKLMYGMINYLGSLTGNNVVLSEYANIFGMNVSDLVAARNAQSQLGAIRGSTISSDASSLATYLGRYNAYLNASPATLYDNLFANALFGMGANVASSRGAYGMYKVGGLIGDITKGMGLTGISGNLINLIGPGIQLAAALTGDESGGLSLKKIPSTLTGLVKTFGNLFADPNAAAAYNLLTGSDLSAGAGALARLRGGVNNEAVNVSSSSSASSSGAYGDTSKVEVSLSETMNELEEAQAARTADDIYEFLSDDVVTVTPYVGESNVLENIANYNLQTAHNTGAIYGWMVKYLGPYLMFESANEGNSLLNAANATDATEEARSLGASYTNWLGSFGG